MMKKETITRRTMGFHIVLIVLLFLNLLHASAQKPEFFESVGFTRDRETAETVIAESLDPEAIAPLFASSFPADSGIEDWWIESSKYLMEYNVGTDFLDRMEEVGRDFEAVAGIVAPYPNLYVPIVGRTGEGNRVIGLVVFQYIATLNESEMSYHHYVSFSTGLFTPGVDPEYARSLYEIVEECYDREEWQQAVLLRFPSSLTLTSEKILLIREESGALTVIDLFNSAGAPMKGCDRHYNVKYSYGDYAALRCEYEKTVYQTVNAANIVAGGDGRSPADRTDSPAVWLPIVCVAAGVAAAAGVVTVLLKRKKNRTVE